MADITLTVYTSDRSSGANFTDDKTAATSSNNYLFANDGNTRLHVNSTAGSTVTVVTPNTTDGNAIADKALTAGAAKQMTWGPWPQSIYGATVTVTVSANTDIQAVRG